jgi:ELWxxDGT repeat protein
VIDGVLYFPGYRSATGLELWRTKGTEGSTRVVYDATIQRDGMRGLSPQELTRADGRLFFESHTRRRARRGGPSHNSGEELYRSDGTTDGTYALREPTTGEKLNPDELTNAGGQLFFAGVGPQGYELWTVQPTNP